ncbi:MAG: 2,3-bisphosphoglycerate-independent phosphoglycerate mutase [Spirochaetales bacterium]
MKTTYALIVLDGFGVSKDSYGNAIKMAGAKNFEALQKKYPHTTLNASGESVGLYPGQMGNSEVGHLNLGAGRIVIQDSKRISDAIKDGSFFSNKVLKEAFELKSDLHLMGLLSDGGVHSQLTHIFALLDMAKLYDKKNVYLHLFTDGRDSDTKKSLEFVKMVLSYIKKVGYGKIASICGRYYAMDRDKNYERTEKAYNMLVFGRSEHKSSDPLKAIKESHDKGITDEFIEPIVIEENNEPVAKIKDGDSVILFNFRGDRARQISSTFVNDDFNEFTVKRFKHLNYIGFTEYATSLKNIKTAFTDQDMKNTLGEVLANNNKTQLRVAESTKYAHVTYFFNGGVEEPNKNEDRVLVESKKVATFDLVPQMSAYGIVDVIETEVTKDRYDFVLINFANCDMVGHTGNLEATIEAVKTVDDALGKVMAHFKEIGAVVLVTADHGNAENMLTKEGVLQTAHTTNPVPFILVDDDKIDAKLRKDGVLSDVSATILELMGIKKPKEFTATSLIIKQ